MQSIQKSYKVRRIKWQSEEEVVGFGENMGDVGILEWIVMKRNCDEK